MDEKLIKLLRSFGMNNTYMGYRQLLSAVDRVMEDDRRLHNITKNVYWEVAEECGCSKCTVEKNIRTVIQKAWKRDPDKICDLAGYKMAVPPSVSEFIELLTEYLRVSAE